MDLDFINNVDNNVKTNRFIKSFINELQNCLENCAKGDIQLFNLTQNENKIITKFRDEMLLKRAEILKNYANQTIDQGEMYYIYSQNSKMEDGYNLCICEEGKSHIVIEKSKENLPDGAEVGNVLRKTENGFVLDEEATKEIAQEIDNMKLKLVEEQTQFLESKRVEEHVYEMSECGEDRVWLFDLTSGNNEEIEEIDFPFELLKDSKEGDLFEYKNGGYQKI